MKHIKGAALLLIALLTALTLSPLAGAEVPRQVLTLMVYMAGSDLETLSGAATADITEMLRSGVDTDRVNVLVCTGGSKHWQGGFPSDQVCVYRVAGRRPEQLAAYGPGSMGDSATLSRFLKDAVERCPANQYALILWDHGGGPMNGVCFDELYKSGGESDSLELSELSAALEDSPFGPELPLEWIGFDACLMATVETAHICAPFAKYMIASQETEPGSGWNYSFLSCAHEGLSGVEMGSLILEDYMAQQQEGEQQLTLSCVDLSRMDVLEDAVEALFGSLTTMLEPRHFSEVSNGRRDAKSFGRTSTGSEYDLVDLYSIARQYGDRFPERVEALEEALDVAVVKAVGNQENSHGLSLYYPYYNKDYFLLKWQDAYDALDFAPKYGEFMRQYAQVWLGERLTSWSDMRADALPPTRDTQELTMALSPEQVENFASAQVIVMSQLPVQELYYYKIDEIDGIVPDEDGVLHAKYDYRALYAMDEDGNPLGDAIPYTIVDGMYLIRANLTEKTYDQYWNERFQPNLKINDDVTMECRKGFIRCREGEDDTLEVVGFISMLEGEDETGITGLLNEGEGLYMGKQTVSVDSDAWKWVWFLHFPREMTFDDEGRPRPFPEWENPNRDGNLTVEWDEIDNEKPWKLQFRRQQFSGFDLYAQVVVRDTQGNLGASNLLKISNPNVTTADVPGQVVADTPDHTLTLTCVDISGAEFDDGLLIRFDLENHGDGADTVDIKADNLMLNRCLVKERYAFQRTFASGRHVSYVLNVPSKDLPPYLEDTVGEIKFDLVIGEESYPVSISGPIDISMMHATVPVPSPLAEGCLGDLDYRLVGMEEDGESIAMDFIVNNTSTEPHEMDLRFDAWVDGCEWENALDMMDGVIPPGAWRTVHMALSRISPEPDTIFNDNDAPQIDFPTYWGIDAIHSVAIKDTKNRWLWLDLAEPFALTNVGDAPPEGTSLTASDALEARLEGCAWIEDRLVLLVRVKNTSDRTLTLIPREADADGTRWYMDLSGACDSFDDYDEGLAPGWAARMAWRFNPFSDIPAPNAIGRLRIGIKVILGEDEEYFSTPLTVSFDDTPLNALDDWATGPACLTVAPCAMRRNEPVDPLALIDPVIPAPEDVSCHAVTYRARLSDAQAAEYSNAKLRLAVVDEGRMIITGILQQSATLDEDNVLSVDFGGILVCMEGTTMPLTQVITPMPKSWVYELKGVQIRTDNDLMNDTAWFESLFVTLNNETGAAKPMRAEVSRTVGSMEKVTSQSFLSVAYEYEDGEGSKLVSTGSMLGESGPAKAQVKLCMRPVSDFDLLPLFYVADRNGNIYTVPADSFRDETDDE